MKVVCRRCGYEKDIGMSVDADEIESKCPECGNILDVRDSGLMSFDIKVHGLTQDDLRVIINRFIEQLSGSLSLADIIKIAGSYFKNKNLGKK